MAFLSGAFTSYSPSRSQIILGFNRQNYGLPNLIHVVRRFGLLDPICGARVDGLISPSREVQAFNKNNVHGHQAQVMG